MKSHAYGNVFRRQLARLLAITLICLTYGLARQPSLSDAERTELAARFYFQRQPLPQLSPEWPGHSPNQVRKVHPSLKRIDSWISAVGAAAALGDLDGNGLSDDVCYVDTRTDMVIVAPVPSTTARYKPFSLSPAPLSYDPDKMAPMGCLFGDLNEDGQLDILIYYWGRTPIAFLHQGNKYVPREVISHSERWYTSAATLADLDGDGHVDLIVGNYCPDGSKFLDAHATGEVSMQESMSRALNGGGKHLLLWAGSTKGAEPTIQYTEAENIFTDEINHGWTLAVGAADVDGDLLPELYFANDYGPDRFLHNRSKPGKLRFDLLTGTQTFTTPHSSVLGHDSFKGMGVDFADLNSDGIPDMFVSNITSEYGLLESNFLFLSTGKLDSMKMGIAPYVNRSEQLGLSRSGWAWDAKLADFDNDAVFEAIQAIGFIKGATNRWPELQELGIANDNLLHSPRWWPYAQTGDDISGHQHNAFFARAKDNRYYDLAVEVGLGDSYVSRGIAVADVDGDGALDFVLANQWEQSYFFHNKSPVGGTFLGLHLLLPLIDRDITKTFWRPGHPGADTPGRAAIGAAATVTLTDGRRFIAQVDGGNGHSGKRSSELHFGLGHGFGGTPVKVELRWRDPEGQVNRETLFLSPGWHTVVLGSRLKVGA